MTEEKRQWRERQSNNRRRRRAWFSHLAIGHSLFGILPLSLGCQAARDGTDRLGIAAFPRPFTPPPSSRAPLRHCVSLSTRPSPRAECLLSVACCPLPVVRWLPGPHCHLGGWSRLSRQRNDLPAFHAEADIAFNKLPYDDFRVGQEIGTPIQLLPHQRRRAAVVDDG